MQYSIYYTHTHTHTHTSCSRKWCCILIMIHVLHEFLFGLGFQLDWASPRSVLLHRIVHMIAGTHHFCWLLLKFWERCNRVLQLLLWFGITRSCIDLLTVLVVDMGCPLDSLAGIVTHRLLRKSKDTTKSHSIFTASLFWVVEGLGIIVFDFILFWPMVDWHLSCCEILLWP